jgi:hypothetical protein
LAADRKRLGNGIGYGRKGGSCAPAFSAIKFPFFRDSLEEYSIIGYKGYPKGFPGTGPCQRFFDTEWISRR